MSDILPVGQQVNPKSYVSQGTIRPDQQNTQNNFNIVDLAKVLKPNNKDEYGDNSFLENQRQMLSEKFFFNLIKEPGMAAGALKGIFNSYLIAALTGDVNAVGLEEMGLLAKALSLDYSQMIQELFTQADGISMFKGPFFDILRLVYSTSSDPDFKNSIVNLLKAVSVRISNDDVLTSLKSNIQALLRQLPPTSQHFQSFSKILDVLNAIKLNRDFVMSSNTTPTGQQQQEQGIDNRVNAYATERGTVQTQENPEALLSGGTSLEQMEKEQFTRTLLQLINDRSFSKDKLSEVAIKDVIEKLNVKNPGWIESFDIIRNSIAQAVQNLAASPFNNRSLENYSALIMYNLSYLNSTVSNLDDLFVGVLARMNSNQELAALLVESYRDFMAEAQTQPKEKSDLLQSISRFVGNFFHKDGGNTIANQEINNVLRSLIAAPNSFTPLLHFVLPMRYESAQGFGELWVDPYELAKDKKGDPMADRGIRIFFVAEILDVGYFEIELYLLQNRVSVHLFCPPNHLESFKNMKDRMSKAIASTTSYAFEGISVDKLERKRTLPQVFPKLSEKRDGFNVTI